MIPGSQIQATHDNLILLSHGKGTRAIKVTTSSNMGSRLNTLHIFMFGFIGSLFRLNHSVNIDSIIENLVGLMVALQLNKLNKAFHL